MPKAAEAKSAEAYNGVPAGEAPMYRPIQEPLQVQEPDYIKGGWLVHTPKGNPNRIIMDFEHVVWCGSARGLLQDTLPSQLADKGVKPEDWARFTKSCAAIMQNRWTVTSWIMSALFLVPLPCLIGSERNMHKKLGQWLRAINEEVLEPVGCFAKLQMVSETISTGPNSSYTEERAWMAVALTPEESEKLRGEVGLIGLLEAIVC